MATPNLLGLVYVAKQSAKGTPASTATFAHGLTGGKPVSVERERESLGYGTALATELGDVITQDTPVVAVESLAHVKGIGIWLLGALGSVTTTGTGPYQHTFQVAASKPYLTVWGSRLSGSEKQRASDVRLAELSFEWDGPGPLKVSASGYGCDATLTGANPGTPTVDETTSASVLLGQGGTFKVDVGSTTPVTAAIRSGSIRLSGLAEPVRAAGSVLPVDVLPKTCECEVSLTLLADDLSWWRKALTGSGSGSTLVAAPGSILGAFEVTFAEHLGAGTMKLEAKGVAFACDVPDVDPGAGPFEVELSGRVYGETATDYLKATLTNQQASY